MPSQPCPVDVKPKVRDELVNEWQGITHCIMTCRVTPERRVSRLHPHLPSCFLVSFLFLFAPFAPPLAQIYSDTRLREKDHLIKSMEMRLGEKIAGSSSNNIRISDHLLPHQTISDSGSVYLIFFPDDVCRACSPPCNISSHDYAYLFSPLLSFPVT